MAARPPAHPPGGAVLVVIRSVDASRTDEYIAWQGRMNGAVAAARGFLHYEVVSPNPPTQPDWVIIDRFASAADARAWLESPERAAMVAEVAPMLTGPDDLHIVDDPTTSRRQMATAMIDLRIQPGREADLRRWLDKVAAREALFPGFHGYRLQPPVPGIQPNWVWILRFDSEVNLRTWLGSRDRQRLLDDASDFLESADARVIQTGFEAWLAFDAPTVRPPAWKTNMVILVGLYPVAAASNLFLLRPILLERGVPLWLALFIASVINVLILGFIVVPWVSRGLRWWLVPAPQHPLRTTLLGVALLIAIYAALMAIVARITP